MKKLEIKLDWSENTKTKEMTFSGAIPTGLIENFHVDDLEDFICDHISEKIAEKFIQEKGHLILEKMPVDAITKTAIAKVVLKLVGEEDGYRRK